MAQEQYDKPKKEDYWLPPGDGDSGPFFAESEYEMAMELYYNGLLKPCPFCGEDAKIDQTGRKEITIKCPECVIKYVQKTKFQSLDWLRENMIETWNKRVHNNP